jgi:YD repeat-containing protein
MPGSATTLGYDNAGQLKAIEVKNSAQTFSIITGTTGI